MFQTARILNCMLLLVIAESYIMKQIDYFISLCYHISNKQVIMKAILLISLLIALCLSCPSMCNCTSKTLSCSICLGHFFQIYNTTSSKCQCMTTFQFYRGGGEYCCPSTCDKCYEKGCASCETHAEMVWNSTLKFFDCVCSQNYYRTENSCVCMSQIDPTQYYYDSNVDQCYKCPEGCVCSLSGCVSCQTSTNRTVKHSSQTLMVCPCNGSLVDVGGICVCYEGCSCVDDEVEYCLDQSNRFLNYSQWDCSLPYAQVNNTCICDQPYTLLDILGKVQCVCKSKTDYTKYYQIQSVCYKCSESCTCDNRGCAVCNNPYWTIKNFVCSCSRGSSEANGECSCIDPYYYSGTKGSCSCLSEIFPTLYYYLDEVCYICPEYCTCSEKGCISCQPKALRTIVTLPSGFMVCQCILNAAQISNICSCAYQYYYDNTTQSCKCQNEIMPSFAYVFNNFCIPCPQDCLCDEYGCYWCFSRSLRQIKQLNNIFYCPCRSNLIDVGDDCICNSTSKYDYTTKKCECADPYYTVQIDQNTTGCDCKATIDPKHYYIDLITSYCSICPFGCKCDPTGCIDCDPLTMRFIDTQFASTFIYSRCPCLQNSFFVSNTCTVCAQNSYYNGASCTPCLECLTCDRYGCTSCYGNMYLDNYTCVCNNQNLTNINGYCICPKGKYLNRYLSDSNSRVCIDCPKNCYTCTIIDHLIQCTSCNVNSTFRQDVSESNCPCIDGYTEAPVRAEYCCPNLCQDCDGTVCLSCPIYTFRAILNGKCACQQPYYQIGNAVCGCSPTAYYFNQSCLKCPDKCSHCIFNATLNSPQCFQCSLENNRNVSDLRCPCLPGFLQTVPASKFCYAQYCQNNEASCTQCEGGRILTGAKSCVCPMGYYQFISVCKPCNTPGCLKCGSQHACNWCDEDEQYYLVGSTCIGITTEDYIIAQLQGIGLITQIKLNSSFNLTLNSNDTLTATIYRIQPPNSTSISNPISLRIIYILQNQNVITAILSNPDQQVDNVTISLYVDNKQDLYKTRSINIRVDKILSTAMLQDLESVSYRYVWAIGFMFMIIALVINLRGYKHNQIMFYMQTMSFLGYYLGEAKFSTVQFFYNMKVSYFSWALGPFYHMIPTFYFESSEGNFRWLTGDSNIVRVIDLPLLICIVVIGLYIIVKILYLCLVVKLNINTRFIKHKKWFYRFFEYFFKSLMYPIVFFSFNTLMNVNCDVYLDVDFKYKSIAISVICIVFFLLFVIFLYNFGQMSKLYSVELICQLVIDYIASISLIKTLQHKVVWLPVFTIIIIAKDLTYFILRKKLANQKDWVMYLQLAVIPIELIPLIMIYFDLQYFIIASIFVSLISQSAVQFVIIQRINTQAHYDKLKIFVEQDVGSTTIVLP